MRERERERERRVCACVCACVFVKEREGGRERRYAFLREIEFKQKLIDRIILQNTIQFSHKKYRYSETNMPNKNDFFYSKALYMLRHLFSGIISYLGIRSFRLILV